MNHLNTFANAVLLLVLVVTVPILILQAFPINPDADAQTYLLNGILYVSIGMIYLLSLVKYVFRFPMPPLKDLLNVDLSIFSWSRVKEIINKNLHK